MKKFSANYSKTNHNFVIQNLIEGKKTNEYSSAICIIKNIIQRGCPTVPSKYLIGKIGSIDLNKSLPLISPVKPEWERIIRGDIKNNYNPAKKFFDNLIPKYFPEFNFFQQLLVPEVPINFITQIEVLEFSQQQVDFYLPLAFLVIEIDGKQHDKINDKNRDKHLAKFGIKTIRISTGELEAENESFNDKIKQIKERVNRINQLQENKKKENSSFFTFNDYSNALLTKPDLNEPEYLGTSIIRFQLLVLELLECGKLSFSEPWEMSVLCNDQGLFEEIACEDLFLWFENLFRLQRIKFVKPQVQIKRVKNFNELKESLSQIKIDFSLTERYTDKFQNYPDIIFIRTDYFEYYRYYKNTDSVNPKYVDLEPYNYFKFSVSELINYKIQINGDWQPEKSLLYFLENIFGYTTFLPGQLPIIINALSRNDTIGLLPTGGGKSVCYQLAVVLQPAISFVVCPIKSLMYDQKHDLQSICFNRINIITSDDDGEEKEKIMKEFADGKYFFLFISPERFQIKSFRQYLLSVNQNFKIAYAIIDEVHCLSEWGHDFRTSYLNLSKTIKNHCNEFRLIGLTATASIYVLKDIQIEFGIKKEDVKTLEDYTRKELEFEILDDNNNKYEEIKSIIKTLNETEEVLIPKGKESKCGLIFTPTVNGNKGCFSLASKLEKEFRTPIKYFSGHVPTVNNQDVMKSAEFEKYKQQVQQEFKQNKFTLLTATKAFGMGINKGNIHFTIHYGIPGSMESLYQEAGRAGRDKSKFSTNKAKCYVLFTTTSKEDILDIVWDRETPLSKIETLFPKIDGDINTNLFLFKSGIDKIKNEYNLICEIIEQYAKPGNHNVRVLAKEINSNKAKTEKAIYRLLQLGIIDDWTVTDFFKGEFEVDFSSYTEESILTNLKNTINKYDKDFNFYLLQEKDDYKDYYAIWSKDKPIIDKCIVLLLQWAYNHFAYNRRQSLKNIYENCSNYIKRSITKEDFKKKLEDYFKFTESTHLLQHIAENPNDYKKWFEVFYQIDDNKISNEIINWEQRQSLISNLSRFLESYQYNTGLDFISGVLRLLTDDFENADGRNRFVSAFKQIMKQKEVEIKIILNSLLKIGFVMSMKSKNDLARSLIDFFPDNHSVLWKIQEALEDDTTTEIILTDQLLRIKKVNQNLYGKFI